MPQQKRPVARTTCLIDRRQRLTVFMTVSKPVLPTLSVPSVSHPPMQTTFKTLTCLVLLPFAPILIPLKMLRWIL